MKKAVQFTLLFGLCFMFIGGVYAETNLLVNGDLETVTPGFWTKLNEGDGSSVLSWDMENGFESARCIKIEKPGASTDIVGWKSVDNAYLYWNAAKAERLYNLTFHAKTEGVNTNPANDDAKIGVLYQFYNSGALLGEQFVEIDQSAASMDWTEYTGGLLIPAGADPDEMYATVYFGKDATGTVMFDDVDCGCEPWAMGIFNGDFETPEGWMKWWDGDQGFANTVNDTAYSGEWSALLQEDDDNNDEMVFYSEPAPAEPNTWYKVSVMVKTEGVNSGESLVPSNIITDRLDDRLGMCFFFHKAPIDKSWDLAGGDQFFYVDQRASEKDWTEYSVIAKAPEDAAGLSVRARFTSFPVGKVWYDDFKVEKLDEAPNILVNGDLEIAEPGYWNKLNEGDGSSVLSWDMENGFESARCIKIEKPGASTDIVGWKSVDNAYLYWNAAKAERLYNLTFHAKTEGVNTNPANDDAKIGVLYQFYNSGALLGEQFVEIDQSAASMDWTEYTGGLLIPAGADPDEMYATVYFGKDATGTVMFDDVDCGCEPWAMGIFNGDFETPEGWMKWWDGDQGFANTVNDTAYSGEWSALLQEDDENNDEMVFYSEPAPAEPNTWYKVSVMVKTEGVNAGESLVPSNIMTDRLDDRLGMCFFFHKAPIDKSWDLAGGDQFFYVDQRASEKDWTEYSVIAKAPEDAAGLSVRARFTSFPVGKVWYDDFSVQKMDIVDIGTGVEHKFGRIEMPNEFYLAQNYPNPFNPTTTVKYSIPEKSHVQIEIYNVVGQKIRTLFDGMRDAGAYEIQWNALDDAGSMATSGIYFVTLKSGDFVTAKRITLLK